MNELNGTKVKIIGGFKIEESNKEYVLCSYEEDNSDDAYVVISQVINDEKGNKSLISIPSEDKEAVLFFYENLRKEANSNE